MTKWKIKGDYEKDHNRFLKKYLVMNASYAIKRSTKKNFSQFYDLCKHTAARHNITAAKIKDSTHHKSCPHRLSSVYIRQSFCHATDLSLLHVNFRKTWEYINQVSVWTSSARFKHWIFWSLHTIKLKLWIFIQYISISGSNYYE